jgi:hypothetical protein
MREGKDCKRALMAHVTGTLTLPCTDHKADDKNIVDQAQNIHYSRLMRCVVYCECLWLNDATSFATPAQMARVLQEHNEMSPPYL